MDQDPVRSLALAVRTTQDPQSITSLCAELAAIDLELPLFGVRTMQERVDRSLVDRRADGARAHVRGCGAVFAAIGISKTDPVHALMGQ